MHAPVRADLRAPANVVLFGAFDRHNFGDMLFAHIALAEGPDTESTTIAGLVAADLSALGGHHVERLADVLARQGNTPLHLIHVGGEILTCDRWVARVTTLGPAEAGRAIARCEHDHAARETWLRTQTAFSCPAPYVVRRSALPPGSQTEFRAVGGVGFAALDEAMRSHVVAALREAGRVTVRDAVTRRALADAGIVTALERDPIAGLRQHFGGQILDRVSGISAGLGRDYLAIQFSADFGDDATLDRLAAQVGAIARETGLHVVLFRAGAAPWHDELAVLNRLRTRLADVRVSLFGSLDIWDICALIAGASGVIGSSLHVHIVAHAFDRPAVSLSGADASPTGQAAKLRAYVGTWFADTPNLATPDDLAEVFSRAVAGR